MAEDKNSNNSKVKHVVVILRVEAVHPEESHEEVARVVEAVLKDSSAGDDTDTFQNAKVMWSTERFV